MKEVAGRAIRCAVLTQVSMLGALTLRFLWFTRGQNPLVLESYLSSLYYAGMAVRNSLLPSVIVGGFVFYLHERSRQRRVFSSELVSGMVALTAFYSGMGVLALVVGHSIPFPRTLWLASWLIALMILVTTKGTQYLEASERRARARPAQIVIDALVVAVAYLASYAIRFDGMPTETYLQQSAFLACFVVAIYLVSNYLWEVYSLVWRFTSLGEAVIIGQAVFTGASVTALGRILILEQMPSLRIPLGVLLIHPLLTLVGMLGLRTVRRIQFRNRSRRGSAPSGGQPVKKRVLLVGAGAAGQQLARDSESHVELDVVGFLDDDPIKLVYCPGSSRR